MRNSIKFDNPYQKVRKPILSKFDGPKMNALLFLGFTIPFAEMLFLIAEYGEDNNLGEFFYSFGVERKHVFTVLLLIVLVGLLIRLITNRFYKLVKVKEESNSGIKIKYQIQTRLSLKKNASSIDVDKKKWRKHMSYSDKDYAKEYFDKLTAEEVIEEKEIKSIRTRNKKPTLIGRLKQNKYMASMFGPMVSIFSAMFMAFFCVIFLIKFFYAYDELSWIEKYEVEQTLLIIAIGIGVLYLLAKIYMLTSFCYLRVIKRTIVKGCHETSYYRLQSLVTRKKIDKITSADEHNWKDVMIRDRRSKIKKDESSIIYEFKKRTKKVRKVTEEAVD